MSEYRYRCGRCEHRYPWRGGISFGAVSELGRLIREHYAAAHPAMHGGRPVTPAEAALRDAWIAELWPVCREVSREDRAVEKAREKLGKKSIRGAA